MNTTTHTNRSGWLVLAGLLVLSVVPVAAGAVRMTQLMSGAEVTPENARFFASPLPVVVHIISVSVYTVLGAFQFVPAFRRRQWGGRRGWRGGWHRTAGRILIPCGLVAAFSGLWMSQFYPLPESDGEILYGMRLLVGWGMVLFLVLGALSIRRRDFVHHGAWMLRAYALGMGAGTQVLTHAAWVPFFGTPDEFSKAFLMGTGWVINIIVAEWVIRRRTARPRSAATVAV